MVDSWKVKRPSDVKRLLCRPFGACYVIVFTRGFTPGYILSALRACCRAKSLFALHGKNAEGLITFRKLVAPGVSPAVCAFPMPLPTMKAGATNAVAVGDLI